MQEIHCWQLIFKLPHPPSYYSKSEFLKSGANLKVFVQLRGLNKKLQSKQRDVQIGHRKKEIRKLNFHWKKCKILENWTGNHGLRQTQSRARALRDFEFAKLDKYFCSANRTEIKWVCRTSPRGRVTRVFARADVTRAVTHTGSFKTRSTGLFVELSRATYGRVIDSREKPTFHQQRERERERERERCPIIFNRA